MATQEVKQIKIGKHMVGVVGLKCTFEEMARNYMDQTDTTLSRMLLERLAEKNYIPLMSGKITAEPLSGNSESF